VRRVVTWVNAAFGEDRQNARIDVREGLMELRSKRRALQGVNGAVGLVAGLGGYVGHLYSHALATFLMLAIWIVGATLINLLTDPPGGR